MAKYPNSQVMWVAPTYKICKAPIDDVWFGVDENTQKRFIPQFCPNTNFKFWDWKSGDKEVHLWNKSKMFIRSADNPDSIVAKGYNLIIVDEAAQIAKDVFDTQILGTARKNNCKIVIISTPRGKNWFYYKYLDGQDPSKPMYISFKQPWWKRPNYPKLLRKLMMDLPEHIRRQEYEAEFLDGGGGTFVNLDTVFEGIFLDFESDQQEWRHSELDSMLAAGRNFVLGVDFAKSMDYTVITALDVETRRCVYYKRMNKKDYKIVLEILKNLSAELNGADICYDATGVGAGLQDFLSAEANIYPFKFTNSSKNELINKLIVACEYGHIKLPNITTMRQEFEVFEFQLTRTGAITYSAPDGRHDDIVISVGLANWYIEEEYSGGDAHEIDDFLTMAEERMAPKTFLEQCAEDDD